MIISKDKSIYSDLLNFKEEIDINYLKTIKGLSPNTVHEYFYDIRLYLKFMTYRLRLLDFEQNTKIEDIILNDFFYLLRHLWISF